MQITEEQVRKQLENVLDPELNISIVDLGLVYNIAIGDNKVSITMTLTTIGCPLFSQIEQEVKNSLQELGIDNDKVDLQLVFDPPWSMEKMSERAKAMLGI
ncbi:MAG: hypothetical protein RI947_196 [Candidatus Parcubacteria bacterium]|jgi:metal-sulfur cluster biosynthetic enzyme